MKIILKESQIFKILLEISNSDNELLNQLITKIEDNGYESLTPREKLLLRKLTGEKVNVPDEEIEPQEPIKEPIKVQNDKTESDVDESTEISYASLMFFELFPQNLKLNVDGREFRVVLNDFEEGDVETEYEPEVHKYIIITDDVVTLKLFPFHNNTRNFIVITEEGTNMKSRYNAKLPSDEKETTVLVKFTTSVMIPKFIKEIINNNNKR